MDKSFTSGDYLGSEMYRHEVGHRGGGLAGQTQHYPHISLRDV